MCRVGFFFLNSLSQLSFLNFSVHVRRTDKIGTEAAYHGVEEYMEHVGDFFDTYELTHPNVSFKRAVYLATDEISVINDIEKYIINFNYKIDSFSGFFF